MFGKPTAESRARGGFALWKTRGLFAEHMLRDEDVKHCVPRPHHDFFYSSVKFYIPDDKLCDVLKVSGSLNYDGLKKLLTARCGAIGANYATLYLGMAVASGKLTIAEVKKDELYPRMISGEVMSYDKMEKEMNAMKRANHKKYAKELKAEYATYAYKKCYTRRKRGGAKKTRKLNTRGKPCSSKSYTACCPHMTPDADGRYIATNETTVLPIDGKEIRVHTCCKPCGVSMKTEATKDPSAFKRYYKPEATDKGVWLSNRHTGEKVQLAKYV
jgi:hypothetical protein